VTSFPLLDSLPAEETERVLRAARRHRFAKGEVIFHEGDPADTFHVIAEGRCAVRVSTPSGDVATLTVLREGDMFGELALLDAGSLRSAAAVALEPCATLSIRRADFDRLRDEHPSVTQVLMALLTQRIRRLTERLVEALYMPADQRVIKRLLELIDTYDAEGEPCVVRIAQEDLAGLAGTSRATVNRVLRKEAKRATVRLARASITILDRTRLEQRSG